MRAVFEKVATSDQESLRCIHLLDSRFRAPWHFHPEMELTLILRGRGVRFVGDSIEPFQDGDLVLLGPDLPHFWQSQPAEQPRPVAEAIVIQFAADRLRDSLSAIPEFTAALALLRTAERGVRFCEANTVAACARRLRRLIQASGAARVLELLAVLNSLAAESSVEPLAGAGYAPLVRSDEARRIQAVCQRVAERLSEPMSQPEAAALAGMNPAAFSRFFRQKTGRTYTRFVNEVRIGHACRMLLEREHSISEIAFRCGFNNLSNFNRRFREIKRQSPREYLRRFEPSGP